MRSVLWNATTTTMPGHFLPNTTFSMDSPLISIITIVFNGEKHLEQTIRSVLNQTWGRVQYIIIDGGSTDQSIPIIKKYEKDIYSWVSEKDNGISDAFNKGISRATGDIIGIINADDWYEPKALEQVAAEMGDADICFGDVQLWKKEKKEFVQKGNVKLLNREMTINHPTVFIKREMYQTYGAFDLHYKCAMDYDLMLRLLVKNRQFVYLPYTLANMRWGGFSDKKWKTGCRESLAIKNKYLPGHQLKHQIYFLKHMLAIQAAKTLSLMKLGFITRFQRKLFSRVKKIYNS
jgi:glycosyltransferase involved in cell wall biosynthesis